jgi:hypothetical protein
VSIEIATAEIQDKLYWINDNIPVLIAGTISRAIELKDIYREYFDALPLPLVRASNIADFIRVPLALFKNKLANEYITNRFGITYDDFRVCVGKGEVPQSTAMEAYSELSRLDLECELIIVVFMGLKDVFVFKTDAYGTVHHCENFAAIGTGSPIAQSDLYHRNHSAQMTLWPTLYHVYEAMRLGSIASNVGERHTLNVLYPPGEREAGIVSDALSEATYRWLERKYDEYGPRDFKRFPVPKHKALFVREKL